MQNIQQESSVGNACDTQHMPFKPCLAIGDDGDLVSENTPIVLKSIAQPVRLAAGETLFRQNSPVTGFHLLLEGCLKETHIDGNGHESVINFFYPNEFAGMDSLGKSFFDNTTEALVDSLICSIPGPCVKDKNAKSVPCLEHYVWTLMALQMTKSKSRLLASRNYNAAQKLADFLVTQAKKTMTGKLAASHLDLPMSRQDLANHLGMSPETLSRLFADFTSRGLVKTWHAQAHILDFDGLNRMISRPH
ncbi:hypothetical protein CWI75_08345 [Kineobactrum sediminis]|uniref:HTH crp-type domain-containing protein n=1 Tax=Kineobactrum sediminis TaxID=1905677 RepID=A0A2N5Y2H2_9GAMM|nr:Crp/Fnr family transcriptional regulator [Kineobactrum sediminis]PLW82585.1 hypothetical protein CWI75_08345 [Kineobactrum sediminis]